MRFSIEIDGTHIGREMQDDPEEFAYMLTEIATDFPDDIGEQVSSYLFYGVKDQIINLLTNVTWAIEASKKDDE